MSAHMPLSHTNCGRRNLLLATTRDNETKKDVCEIVDTLCRQSGETLYKTAGNDKDYCGHNLFHTVQSTLWIIF